MPLMRLLCKIAGDSLPRLLGVRCNTSAPCTAVSTGSSAFGSVVTILLPGELPLSRERLVPLVRVEFGDRCSPIAIGEVEVGVRMRNSSCEVLVLDRVGIASEDDFVDTGLSDVGTGDGNSFETGHGSLASKSGGDERTERSDAFSGASVPTALWLTLSPGPGRGNVSALSSRLVTARTGRRPAPAAEDVPSTLALFLFALRPGRKLSIGAFSFTRWRLLGGRAASAFRARDAAVDANKPLFPAPRARGGAEVEFEALLMAVPGRAGFGAPVDELLMAVPGREGGFVAGCSGLAVAVARAAVAAVGLNKELAVVRVALRVVGADESEERVDEMRPTLFPTVDAAVAVPLDIVDAADAEPLVIAEADLFCEVERAPFSSSLVDVFFVANLAGAGAPLSPRSLETGRNDFFSTG